MASPVAMAASFNSPSPHISPIAAVSQTVAAVVSPLTCAKVTALQDHTGAEKTNAGDDTLGDAAECGGIAGVEAGNRNHAGAEGNDRHRAKTGRHPAQIALETDGSAAQDGRYQAQNDIKIGRRNHGRRSLANRRPLQHAIEALFDGRGRRVLAVGAVKRPVRFRPPLGGDIYSAF